MPHTYSICVEKRLVRVECKGPGSLAEGAGVLATVAEDPLFVPGFGLLVDVRECKAALSPQDVRAFVDLLKALQKLRKSRMAIVTGTALYFGFGRMMAALSETAGITMKVFRDMDEALVWVMAGEPGK